MMLQFAKLKDFARKQAVEAAEASAAARRVLQQRRASPSEQVLVPQTDELSTAEVASGSADAACGSESPVRTAYPEASKQDPAGSPDDARSLETMRREAESSKEEVVWLRKVLEGVVGLNPE